LTVVESNKKATEIMAEVYEVEEEEVTCPIVCDMMREAQVKDFPEEQHNQ
jgi:hypothetical protein